MYSCCFNDQKLYKRDVDDIYSKQIKNQPDKLFEKLNNYHTNIKLAIGVNPSILDTDIMIKNCITETSVAVKIRYPITVHQQFPKSINEVRL